MDFCTNLTSKFWTNQEISFWQQFWFLDRVEIWFPRFRVHFWTQRPLGRSAPARGLMFDIRLCGKPMENPGKLKKLSSRGGSCKHRPCSSWWYSAVLVEEKIFLIKSSSAKISRWIFSEGRGGSILHVRNLPSRDCHYYPEWALIQVDFSNQTFSQQKFYGRISPLTDQLFSRGKFFGVSPLRPPDRTTLKTFPERILLRRLCCQSTEL